MDLNNKKRKGGVALASRRLGRVEKGQPLILGANKMEGGYNFAVEASEDSEVSLLLYKKRGAAAPVEIVFPKDFHTGRVWALKLCSASLRYFEDVYKRQDKDTGYGPPAGTYQRYLQQGNLYPYTLQ